jgi:hypothetical protein
MTLFVWPPQSINTSGLATSAGQTATNTKLDTIAGYVDGLEALVGTTNTVLSDRLSGSLVPAKFDYIGYTDGGASETFVYKTGGSGGTTQKTITVTYADSSKAVLVSVAAT